MDRWQGLNLNLSLNLGPDLDLVDAEVQSGFSSMRGLASACLSAPKNST